MLNLGVLFRVVYTYSGITKLPQNSSPMNELESILKQHGLENYCDNLKKKNIHTVTEFIKLRYTDLERTGITYVKDKRKIYDLICELRNKAENNNLSVLQNEMHEADMCLINANNGVKNELGFPPVGLNSLSIDSLQVKGSLLDGYDLTNELFKSGGDMISKTYEDLMSVDKENSAPMHRMISKRMNGQINNSLDVNSISLSDTLDNKMTSKNEHQNLKMINKENIYKTNLDLENAYSTNSKNNIAPTHKMLIKDNAPIPLDINKNFNKDQREIFKHKMINSKKESDNHSRTMRDNDKVNIESISNSFFDSSIIFKSNKISQQKDKSLISSIFRRPGCERTNIKQSSNKTLETVTKKDSKDYSQSKNKTIQMTTKIMVCVRKKPVDKEEQDIVECKETCLNVFMPKTRLDLSKYVHHHQFDYDFCYDADTSNVKIFEDMNPLYEHIINGGNGTIIAYGQTGTGKTHTMFHQKDGLVFQYIERLSHDYESISLSFYEIYNSSLYDLFDYREKMLLREKNGNVFLSNVVEKKVKTLKEAVSYIEEALLMRKNGITEANAHSSRSHAILRITVNNKGSNVDGSLVFVDLAGSERGSDRKKIDPYTINEGAEINKSLLALKECIRGIDSSRGYLPFRQSKLTQILKSSFTGDTMTCIIATINPGISFIEHTMNTLRYASKLRGLKNTEKISSPITNKIPNSSEREPDSKYDDDTILRFKMSDDIKNNDNIEFKKNVFDSTFIRENSSEGNFISFLSQKNIDEKNMTIIYKKKINNLVENILNECKGSCDVRMLRRVSQLLKNVNEKICEMKF